MLRIRHFPRVAIDEELARFQLYLWSPNEVMDKTINHEIMYYDRGSGEDNVPFETGVGRFQREVERLIKIYFPPDVELRAFNIEYSKSVTVTFSLIWVGTISLYVLVSRYDNFRKSLDRLKDDLANMMGRIAKRSHVDGPIAGDMRWEPSRLLVELEELRSNQVKPTVSFTGNGVFITYLIVSNIILSLIIAILVFRAVKTVYFP